MVFNKCSVSYGLVVKSVCNSIIVLQRKVPYCVQDFFLHLSRKKGYSLRPLYFPSIRKQFEAEWLPRLKPRELEDYHRFLNGEVFEDEYDFPHGQLPRKRKHCINKFNQFCTAYREFKEESGFHFCFTKQDIEHYPMVWVMFEGLDGFQYKQYYFIVNYPKELRRHSYFNSFNMSCTGKNQIKNWNDDRLVYYAQLMPLDKAHEKFLNQQNLKCDMKHILCLDSVVYHLVEDQQKNESETEIILNGLVDGNTKDDISYLTRNKINLTRKVYTCSNSDKENKKQSA